MNKRGDLVYAMRRFSRHMRLMEARAEREWEGMMHVHVFGAAFILAVAFGVVLWL